MSRPVRIEPGRRYGFVVVVDVLAGTRTTDRRAVVICDCGEYAFPSARYLVRAKNPTCGKCSGRVNRYAVPGYVAAHHRVVAKYGKASEYECLLCDRQAEEWAWSYLPGDTLYQEKDGPNAGLVYSLNPDAYAALCRLCHAAVDGMQDRTLLAELSQKRRGVAG